MKSLPFYCAASFPSESNHRTTMVRQIARDMWLKTSGGKLYEPAWYGNACLAGWERYRDESMPEKHPEIVVFIDGDYSDFLSISLNWWNLFWTDHRISCWGHG